uniref:Uncharacterized protein n=1 Tax=Mesocestoides corti TaxID=53468 RepID=A0A5K3G4X9_MESCO
MILRAKSLLQSVLP